jgi:hypothetical protein
MRKHAVAEVTKASSSSTLNVAIGPQTNVIGDPSTPSSGIVVLSIRLTPTGAFKKLLASGLTPCTMAHGVWARNQISSCTSVLPDVWIVWVTPWAHTVRLAR